MRNVKFPKIAKCNLVSKKEALATKKTVWLLGRDEQATDDYEVTAKEIIVMNMTVENALVAVLRQKKEFRESSSKEFKTILYRSSVC